MLKICKKKINFRLLPQISLDLHNFFFISYAIEIQKIKKKLEGQSHEKAG
jgi:hypothetical protein